MTHCFRRQMFPALLGALGCLLLIGCGGSERAPDGGMQLTTRVQTVRPVPVPGDAQHIAPREVAQYGANGYSAWKTGPGENQGRRFDLMPQGYQGAPAAGQLASFFTMSDVHITDKESPAQLPYFGWTAPYRAPGLISQAYSPVMLSGTQVLDAAVRTINALHRRQQLDFGILLGDAANSSQYNELRWYIDVMDGQWIEPSSGDHRGADTIDYQKPFQAEGLDRSLPWYACVGNHDQYWMGVQYPSPKLQAAFTAGEVLNIGPNVFSAGNAEANGVYVGVVDGATEYGEVVKGGPTAGYPTPPTVVADERRHSLTTPAAGVSGWVNEFFASTSLPAGHGLTRAKTGSTAACYSFRPHPSLPLKVIVLDDTCKAFNPTGGLDFYGAGWIDADRLAWLTDELQKGQDAEELMIIATHIPINPQTDLSNTTRAPQFYSGSYRSDAQLINVLHRYPNLVMVMAGHRHVNTVTPQPSPDPAHPENGFWEVETPSLRDFPQQFRTFEIRRNSDNTISIVTTDVDPQVEPGSPAAKSRGYAVAANRVFNHGGLRDTGSRVYNAELVKYLTPAMQRKIALFGKAPAAAAAAAPAPGAPAAQTKQTTAVK